PRHVGPELLNLLGYPLGIADRPSAQAPLREVDLVARQARERRAQVREERCPFGARPGEAEQGDERAAERCTRQTRRSLERVWHACRPEGPVERPGEAV